MFSVTSDAIKCDAELQIKMHAVGIYRTLDNLLDQV